VADPLLQAGAAVYGRLSGDATLAAMLPGGVWATRAPVDIDAYPLATFALLPGRTDYTFPGPYRHVFDLRVTFLDKSEDDNGVGTASDRVLVLLQDADDAALPMTNYDVLYCRRHTLNQTSPVREGEQFQQLIHGYRLEVRPV
jgi:hypothetical protein